MTTRRVEPTIALASAALSWLVTPPGGVLLHWAPDEVDPWRAPAIVYACIVAILVIGVGRFTDVRRSTEADSGTNATAADADTDDHRLRRMWRTEAAVGAACTAFAALQRVEWIMLPVSLGVAALLGAGCFLIAGKLTQPPVDTERA